jgi:hypothetical protein
MDDGTKVKVVASGAEDDTVEKPSSTASGGKTADEPSAKKSVTGQEEKQP